MLASTPPTGRPTAGTAAAAAAVHPPFDREAYKQRDTVARCVNKLAAIFIWSAKGSGGDGLAPEK
ncbi:hypothetical protein ACPCBC_01475 [Streptomyces incarnatus]